MKKYIIILISLLLLFSSFAAGFIVKKHIDDKKFADYKIEKRNLEIKNKDLLNKISNLENWKDFQKQTVYGYKKDKIAPIDYYLYDSNPDRFKKININKNGDVEYNGKVIFKDNGEPLNDNNAYTTLEIKIIIAARHIKPREGCDPDDTEKNGTLGCYVDIPD